MRLSDAILLLLDYFLKNIVRIVLKKLKIITTIFLIILIPEFSNAQIKTGKPFNIDFTREAVIFVASSVTSVASFTILEKVKPLTIDEINSLNPQDISHLDRNAIGPQTDDHLGNILLYTSYLIPLTFLTYGETKNDFLDLTLIYSEVLLIQASINGIVKGAVQRTRPYVYDSKTPLEEKQTTDARISFFSGHTSMTAAISFFTARIFAGYMDNDAARIIIWSSAAILPAVVAYSRVNTHWHFPTDVITGYAVGALIGYLIPELHKTKSNGNGNLSIYPSMYINKPTLSVLLRF